MKASTYRADYRRFCEILRDLREEAGLRQVDLAHILGVPQSFVSKYETAERRLDVVETARIAHALGVDLGEIVDRFEHQGGG